MGTAHPIKNAIIACLTALAATHAVEGPPPNFVVIFIDDLGYAEISPLAKDRHAAPNLDHMAREGRLFNETRLPLSQASVLWPGDRKGLNPDEVTIAAVLKERGYATACIGMWHLGDQPPFLPTRQGFDEYFGIPHGHDMGASALAFKLPPPMVKQEFVIKNLGRDDFGYLTRRYTDYAVDFIGRNAEKPFFIYLPHNMVHGPHAVSPAFMGKTGKGIYADAVAESDWSVGRILDRLVELKLDQRTLVLFTSDNGGEFFEAKTESQKGKGPILLERTFQRRQGNAGGRRLSCPHHRLVARDD